MSTGGRKESLRQRKNFHRTSQTAITAPLHGIGTHARKTPVHMASLPIIRADSYQDFDKHGFAGVHFGKRDELDMDHLISREWDAIVIGTGIGGGSVGRALTEAGLSLSAIVMPVIASATSSCVVRGVVTVSVIVGAASKPS